MNALHRLAFRLRALRIDLLRADIAGTERLIRRLEAKQRASLNRCLSRQMATQVPEFLRRGRP